MNKSIGKFFITLFLISLLYLNFPTELKAQTELDSTIGLILTEEERMLNDILFIMDTKGEVGLREYAKTHKEILSHEIINWLIKEGYNQSLGLLNIALILSDESKNKRIIADVNFYYANYKI